MQKKIIALAIAAAFSAPAFADSTVYGIVDAALANIAASGAKSDTLAVSGGLSSSRIGVKTAEDLNNGMKAVAVLEYSLNTETSLGSSDTAATPSTSGIGTARQQILALAGDFGTFATGYAQTTGYDWQVKFDPTAGSAVSPLQSMNKAMLIGTVAAGARAPRALAYISPDMGGVTVAVNYTTEMEGGLGNLAQASGNSHEKATAYLASATYTGGPLSVGAVYAKLNAGNGTALATKIGAQDVTVTDMALGASYDLGVAKLFATYQTSKANVADSADKAMSFSVVAPVGPGAVAFQYAKNTPGTGDNDGSGFVLVWLQGLSKTTTFYAAVEQVKNGGTGKGFAVDNNAPVVIDAGGSSTMLAAGLKKTF